MRVTIAIVVAIAVIAFGSVWAKTWFENVTSEPASPWFAAYVDVTAIPQFAFESPSSTAARDVVLSFIVSDDDEPCSPSWGNYYSLDEAAGTVDLDRRIARLTSQGGEAIVSFGGALNNELATACTDASKLADAYSDVVTRYSLSTIDLDIEAENLGNGSGVRRAEAIADVQSRQRAAGNDLAVWLTLPVTPAGLSEEGTDEVAQFLGAGVDLAGVNVMTMDFGDGRQSGQSMLDASVEAVEATHRQLGALYERSGMELSEVTLWSKLGATPMIGQNDEIDEVFGLDAAAALNTFALESGMGRLSMWSLNRDATCGANYVDLTRVSDACSGVDQGDALFASQLGAGMTGRPGASAATATTPEPKPEELVDDPTTSPYPIWSEDATYVEGSKVVWHHTVYLAKWWNRAEVPDNPVLNEWDTPWELIGPVLPGETPAPVIALPAGTYPEWSAAAVYTAGVRVMFDGVAFEAKWWNQGENPAAGSASPDDSPWTALTQAEILDILGE